MTTTTIERDVVIPVADDSARTPFSWSAAIAGAFAATAVALMIAALGTGIGLSLASPYSSGPSMTTVTIAAAVWLVMAQTMGFAAGGYLAGRLRSPAYDGVAGETAFRDAAQGLVVWALGVVAMATIAGILGLFAAGATTQAAAGVASGLAAGSRAPSAAAPTDYFVDLMFRPGTAEATAGEQRPAPSDTVGEARSVLQAPLNAESRAEITRVLARAVAQGGLGDDDRAYLARVVSARTGLSADEAERRVAEVENKARETADKATKGGAYVSFWTFMSLLLGGAAATLAGILGGQLRDAEGRRAIAD